MALTSPESDCKGGVDEQKRERENTQKLQPSSSQSKRELLNGIKRSGNKSARRGFRSAMHGMS